MAACGMFAFDRRRFLAPWVEWSLGCWQIFRRERQLFGLGRMGTGDRGQLGERVRKTGQNYLIDSLGVFG